jgi:hypothetical protein
LAGIYCYLWVKKLLQIAIRFHWQTGLGRCQKLDKGFEASEGIAGSVDRQKMTGAAVQIDQYWKIGCAPIGIGQTGRLVFICIFFANIGCG